MRIHSLLALLIFTVVTGGQVSTVQAGPLLEWLFRGRQAQQPGYAVGAPVPLGHGYGASPSYGVGYPGYGAGYPSYGAGYPSYGAGYPGYGAGYPAHGGFGGSYGVVGGYAPSYAANLGNYYGSQLPVIGPTAAGYAPQVPSGLSAATLPMPVPMSYVPNYNSQALRAPVTYYRPLMTTDPNSGSPVVAMAPCTSYQYLTQRVPGLGQSALYGTYPTPQPMLPAATPSYTLPSGGIPLAQSSIAAPNMTGGTALGYSPYSTYYASPSISGITSYPTTSMGTSTYPTTPAHSSLYPSSPSGGSTGSIYSPSVPGLVAPQVPNVTVPNYPAPASSTPSITPPSYSVPSTPSPSSILPPNGGSLSDPGSVQPTLPPNFNFPSNSLPPNSTLRPRLQSIVPEATPSGTESARLRSQERSLLSEPSSEVPSIAPIPAPRGLEKPTWSPGLLRNEDMTALRPVTRTGSLAGQSKPIQWASFDKPVTRSSASPAPVLERSTPAPTPSPAVRRESNGWKPSR